MPHENPRATIVSAREIRGYVREAATRMPFRFGAARMDSIRIAYARARVEAPDGRSATGVSASVLSPLWFDKDGSKSLERRERDLRLSVRLAFDAFGGAEPGPAYRLHRDCEREVEVRGRALGLPPLVAGFGVALVDGAVIDGLCRLAGATFHSALGADLLGFGPVPGLPGRPLDSIAIRHTVGLGDPLVERDLGTPLADGLPETLEQVARTYGCTWFKVKVSADLEASLERLARIAEVLGREAPDYRLTLDGNEQLADPQALEDFAQRARGHPALRELWERTAWIEQPLARDAALGEGVAPVLSRIDKPVILDESGDRDEVLEEGLALGYRGISAKNAKGVFRTLHSQRVIHEWNARGEAPAVLSSEDLTNPPQVPLQQDLCVAASLGIAHTERNGHHYVRGLDLLSEGERRAALSAFPTLYERRPDGLVTLRIADGRISTAEVVSGGYGVRDGPQWEALEPLELPDPAGGDG